MGQFPQRPSHGWKRDVLDAGLSLAVAALMLQIGLSSGQAVFVFMAGAMVLIGGGEALRSSFPGPGRFLLRVGRISIVVLLAYAALMLFFRWLK